MLKKSKTTDLNELLESKQKERDRRDSKPMDATPFVEAAMAIRDFAPPEIKAEFLKRIEQSTIKAGGILLARAIDDGTVTTDEWQENGLTPQDASSILLAHYAKIDGHVLHEEQMIISMPEARIYKAKNYLLNKFNLKVITPQEALILMEKDKVDIGLPKLK